MKKIKDSLSNGLLGLMLMIFAITTAFSIGLQSLLFWIGGSNFGLWLDSLLGALLILPVIIAVAAGIVFDRHESLIVALLAIVGIYINVVCCFSWLAFFACVVVLTLSLRQLAKIGADMFIIHTLVSIYLIYCIGAHFAMSVNGLRTVANNFAIVILSIAVLDFLVHTGKYE